MLMGMVVRADRIIQRNSFALSGGKLAGGGGPAQLIREFNLIPVKNYESFIESRVGSIRYDRKEKAFTVELIKTYTPYLLLRVEAEEVDDHYKFGRISFIDAATGKEK